MTKIICFWEAPRSRGTSISYAMYNGLRASGFMCVYRDEPLHRRKLAQIIDDEGAVARDAYITDIKNPSRSAADFVVQKEQAKWLFDQRTRDNIGPDLSWIRGYTNVILFRDAGEMVTSHQKKLANENRVLDMEAVGIEQLLRIVQFLDKKNEKFTVVDTNELLADPRKGMQKLSEQLGVPFSEGMIAWDRPDIQPPLWGAHWYEDIMQSDGLRPYRPSKERPLLDGHLNQLVQETEAILAQMRPRRLRFETAIVG